MVSVVNALDNTGQVELTLLPSGAGKLALRELSRTPVVEPALVTARIELPDGADTSASSIAATLFASASQAGANPPAPYALTLEKVGERTYESPRVLVVRSPAPLPAALAGTAVVAVAGAGDSLTLRSGAVPGHASEPRAAGGAAVPGAGCERRLRGEGLPRAGRHVQDHVHAEPAVPTCTGLVGRDF